MPLGAKVRKNVTQREGFASLSQMHRLFGTSVVYLFDVDSGCMLRRPVLARKEGFDYVVQIGGVETDAIIKLPKPCGTSESWWVEWRCCDSLRIDGSLTYCDAVSIAGASVMLFVLTLRSMFLFGRWMLSIRFCMRLQVIMMIR